MSFEWHNQQSTNFIFGEDYMVDEVYYCAAMYMEDEGKILLFFDFFINDQNIVYNSMEEVIKRAIEDFSSTETSKRKDCKMLSFHISSISYSTYDEEQEYWKLNYVQANDRKFVEIPLEG